MLSAPSVLQTLYLHYFPLGDLIAFYLTLDISCEIQWLHFQYESIHCFCVRMARANATQQWWIQKPSHMSRFRWKWLWQMRIVFYHADYLQGLRFLETFMVCVFSIHFNSPTEILIYMFGSICDLIVWGWSTGGKKGGKMVYHVINKNLIITPAFFACTCWHLFEQYTWTGSWGSGFLSHSCIAWCSHGYIRQKHTIVETTHSMKRKLKIPVFQCSVGCLNFLHNSVRYIM